MIGSASVIVQASIGSLANSLRSYLPDVRRIDVAVCTHGDSDHAGRNGRHSFSLGFACCPDVQLSRHEHKFSERSGVHLEHHAGSVNFDGLFAGPELDARLFVE